MNLTQLERRVLAYPGVAAAVVAELEHTTTHAVHAARRRLGHAEDHDHREIEEVDRVMRSNRCPFL